MLVAKPERIDPHTLYIEISSYFSPWLLLSTSLSAGVYRAGTPSPRKFIASHQARMQAGLSACMVIP